MHSLNIQSVSTTDGQSRAIEDLYDDREQSNINNSDNDEEVSPWRNLLDESSVSLPEVHGTIRVHSADESWIKRYFSFIGPGAMVAVGYMDPGNWSTDLAGGSQFGYTLLSIILMSSIIAMFLQALAVRAGITTKRDLAQICRDMYPQRVVYVLWVVMEIAIIATDIAEVIGSAVAMKLLFGIPLIAGVFVTVLDIFIVLYLQGRSFRYSEVIVATLILVITGCFAVQMILSKPSPEPLFYGFVPQTSLVTNKEQLYIAIGILGATVMPHNLFLHSSIVLTRDFSDREPKRLKEYIRFATYDSTLSLLGALFVNSAILILAAATFYRNGYHDVATLEQAYELLTPLLGSRAGSILFGIALLASGLNSTLTGTLSGQIVMEGFTKWSISPVWRRAFTRMLAIIPSVIVVSVGGDKLTNDLLILSQVTLSFALPFAVIPLVHVTGSKAHMGNLVNSMPVRILSYLIALFLIALNIMLLV